MPKRGGGRLLRYLIIEPLRWAIAEVWQWILAIALPLGAWWIGHASGGRWWLALVLGVGFLGVFLVGAAWVVKLTGGDQDTSESAS